LFVVRVLEVLVEDEEEGGGVDLEEVGEVILVFGCNPPTEVLVLALQLQALQYLLAII
jgi:hypothetical protein